MRRSKQKYFFCFSSFSLIYFVFFDRLTMADQTPLFDLDAKSCFLDFIEGAETRLVELLGEADSNLLGEYLRDSLEDGRINCGRPLDSSSPLLVILKLLQKTTTICGLFSSASLLLCVSSPLPLFSSASLLTLRLCLPLVMSSFEKPLDFSSTTCVSC